MSWERDPLWSKARLFFEHALEHPREDPRFGLWCSLGLELLARAALASISPTLIAEPDRDHKNLLHALGRGDARVGGKSISASQAIKLCQHLFASFTAEDTKAATALFSRRNADLHTGASAFEDYTTQHWIVGFYRCCSALVEPLGESLSSLLGDAEADVAAGMVAAAQEEVRQRVKTEVAAHARVFASRSEEERASSMASAEAETARLSYRRFHRVTCPACKAAATVNGDAFGEARVTHDEDDVQVVVRQAVVPQSFRCTACGLKLQGYADLAAANLANQYTRTTRYSPEEYFELINPDDADAVQQLVESHLYEESREFDNE